MTTKFGFAAIRPPVMLTDDEFHRITKDYVCALEELGGESLSIDEDRDSEPIFYLIATGGTEEAVLTRLGRDRKISADDPVFVIAHPSANSLPASLEVVARLRQEGRQGRVFYLQGPNDEVGLGRIAEAANDLSTTMALKRTRIGLVGEPSDWLVASSPDPNLLTTTWGPSVVPIGMDEIEREMGHVSRETILPVVESLTADATEVREPSPADHEDVVRVFAALEKLVTSHRLDALTVRCFDLVLNQRTTGCFALARLNDQGVIAGCEGDLVSTMGMVWAHTMLGEIPWMANPAQLDEAENTLWLAHCTVPVSLTSSYGLRSHFESGMGVAIQGLIPAQPVTLLRIGGSDMKELWLAEGEILGNGVSESLCRTQVEIRLDRGHVSELLNAPLGNHLVMARGHHADRLRSWHETFIDDRTEAISSRL